MLKIAVVDDYKDAAEALKQLLSKDFAERRFVAYEIDIFSSGNTFLCAHKNEKFDFVILDIYLESEDMTGVDIARALRENGDDVTIAFCTNSNEFASESYDLEIAYYLRKPATPEGIKTMLDRLGMQRKKRNRSVILPNGNRVLLRGIIRTQYYNRYVTIYTAHLGKLEFRMTQASIESLLLSFESFYSVGQSDIINFEYVKCIKDNYFELSNGDRIAIPRRLLKDAKDAYSKYFFKKSLGEDL